MAKRKATRRTGSTRSRKTQQKARTAKRPAAKARTGAIRRAAAKPARRKKTAPRSTTRPYGPPPKTGAKMGQRTKGPAIYRERRRLEESVPTPPSSLDMKRKGTAARTGRAEIEQERREHAAMTPAITGGDVDADWETAYFSGDEAPGGDNPTPDQDVVDDIGKALGVEYQDSEELKSSDKITERDKHRWELDPASSEDYKERD